jgi:membrane fusion protein (multidrug efflux system)
VLRRRNKGVDFWTGLSIYARRFIAPSPSASSVMAVSPAVKKRLPLIIAGVVGLGLVVGGVVWWQGKQRWEATDNAFVQADTTSVSPQVEGYVVEVLVADNQRVEAGQVLIRLDDADARVKLAQAEANLAALEAGVANVDARAEQEQALIASRAASVAQAQAQADLARQQVVRPAGRAGLGVATAYRDRARQRPHRAGLGRRGPGRPRRRATHRRRAGLYP